MQSRRNFIVHCTRLVLLGALTLTGCSDEAPTEREPAAAADSQPLKLYQAKWLKVTDANPPEQWLASREAKRDLPLDEPAVLDMARVLSVATMRFRDHPRMIANRAVQLEEMLGEKNIRESAPKLIVTISQVPGPSRSVESFAALTQQYFNLRAEGLGQGPAIDTLKQRIGRVAPEAAGR
jgi:hypothetical protein